MEKYALQNALAEIFKVIGRANKYIDENEPWRLAKDEANKPRLARVMYNLLETVRICAGLLRPFMPDTADEILRRLGNPDSSWESLAFFGTLYRDAKVENGPALFPRIDTAKELETLEAMMHPAEPVSAEQHPESELPEPKAEIDFDTFDRSELTVVKVLACDLVHKYAEQMDKFALQNALAEIFKVIGRANKYIDENEPWRLAKDEANKPRLARVMYNLLETVRICAGLLRPFMPDTADEILRRLGNPDSSWESLGFFGTLYRDAKAENGPALFPRIDAAKELEALEALMKPAEAQKPAAEQAPKAELPEPKAEIDFDTFDRSELTVVKVLACEKVKKSEKLLKFQLDDGTGTPRQILSGIAKYYQPDELIGKTLVAVTNLAPRKLMGQLSCGMLLSAEHGGRLTLLTLDDAIPAGARLG